MKFINKRLLQSTRKKAFTLVEVVAAIGISSITLVTMVKVSLQMTQQALKNDAADKATQIASRTAETLWKLRQTSTISGSANTSIVPTIYTLCGADNIAYPSSVYVTSQYDPIKFINMYLEKNTNNNIQLTNTTTLTASSYNVDGINQSIGNFVTDNLINDPDNFYKRSISLQYNPTYKIMIARVIVQWNLYGHDYFYTTFPTFSLALLCP